MPETSYGIWEGTTNLCPNGGVETNLTGWAAANGIVVRDTSESVFGSACALFSCTGGALVTGLPGATLSGATAGRKFVISCWVKGQSGSIGKTWRLQANETGGATGQALLAFKDVVLTSTWQRVYIAGTIAQNDRTGISLTPSAFPGTNLIGNSDFEVGTTGWQAGAGTTISRDSTQQQHGSYSLKVVGTPGNYASVGSWNGTFDNFYSLLPSTHYCLSAWIYNTIAGKQFYFFLGDNIDLAAGTIATHGGTGWERLSSGSVIITDTHTNWSVNIRDIVQVNTTYWVDAIQLEVGSSASTWIPTSASGDVMKVDGLQIEEKPTWPTPYVETNGATASRVRATVTGPATVLNKTQGWAAMRLKMGWPSSIQYPRAQPIRLFEWDAYGNEGWLAITMGDTLGKFAIDRWQSVRHQQQAPALTWDEGDYVTVIGAWDANSIKISVNGNAFTVTSCVPGGSSGQTTFSIGGGTALSDDQISDCDVLWFGCGTGTLTDAQAYALHQYGNNDPSRLDFVSRESVPTLLWTAQNANYIGVFNWTTIPLPSDGPAILIPTPLNWSLIHLNHNDYALGEVYPRSLDFAVYLNRVGYCNYDVDLKHSLGRRENTSPYETDFILMRGTDPVMGGEHTSVSVNDVESGNLGVAGLDWGHWLERQIWPFDPADPTANTYLETGRDIALVVKDILTQILAFPQTLDLDLTLITAIGNLIDYKIEVNDTEDIYSKLIALAKRVPGFDFDITWDKKVILYYPQKGGANGITLTQGHNVYGVEYTNNGPTATYTLGTARSASSQVGVAISMPDPQYRRAMVTQDFGDITDEAQLQQQTQGEAERNITPHRVITLSVVKEAIDVWKEIGLGDTVSLDVDTGYEFVDGDWRVVGMQCTTTDEGDEEWKLTVDDGTLSL